MRLRLSSVKHWLPTIAVILYFRFLSSNVITPRELTGVNRGTFFKDDSVLSKSRSTPPTKQFAIVTCFAKEAWTVQLGQLAVLFKSLAFFTSTPIQINIVCNTAPKYETIFNLTASWPEVYRERIIFGKLRHLYYPHGFKTILINKHGRKCATEKLFLPKVFADLDAMIILDTDLLFMAPPEDLWQEFENFEAKHIAGIAPCLAIYGRNFTKFPAYGFSGLNTGVILMNLTRIRNFTNGWEASINESFNKYNEKLRFDDQDIFVNLFSGKNAKYLYELGCDWNYRAAVCGAGYNKCPAAASRGVSIMHGCSHTFHSDREPTIRAVFRVWEKYQLGSPAKDLLRLLEEALSKRFKTGECRKLSNFKDIYLKGIKRFLKQKGFLQ